MEPNSLNTKLKNAIRIDRALKFVWQASPSYVLLSGFLIATLGTLPLISLYLIKLIIDSVTALAAFETQTNLSGSNIPKPLIYIGLACCVGLFTALLNFFADYIKKAQSITVTDHMFSVLHDKSQQLDLSYYESSDYRDTLFRAQREGPYRPTNIVNALFIVGQNGVAFIAVFGLIFMFTPFLSIAMLAVALPGIIIRLRYSEKLYHWQEKRTEDERRAYYFHWMLTEDTHAKEFKLFDLNHHFIQRFKKIRATLKQEKLHLEKRRAFGDFIAQACMTLSIFGSFAYIAFKTAHGMISIGEMVMFLQGFQKGLTYLKTVLENAAQMYEDNLFLSHFYKFLKLEPVIVPPDNPHHIPKTFKSGIKFNNVEFFYQNSEKKVINCVNFSIKSGEIVAIVGPNGSGKSTIVKLLTRLYDPQKGTIQLDGVNIKNFHPSEYRKKFSAVFQDHIKYQLPVKENIYMGNVDFKNDSNRIIKSATLADAHKTISSLPDEYETILGRWFKNGEELSQGQWQALSIARAFFRDAPFIILDEPSSSLDPESEMNIFAKLKKLIKNRSALIISHRYSTVKMADRIIVLDKGEIIEQGSHRELLKANGNYARLYKIQADNYKPQEDTV